MAEVSKSDPSGILQPGQIIRPFIKADDVPSLVQKLYGLTVTSVKELNSYDDKNFYIKVTSEVSNPHIKELCPHGFTLKVLNSMDTKNGKLVEAQNEAMLFLHSKGFSVPKPEKNTSGSYMKIERLKLPQNDFLENNVGEEQSGEYMVRLLTFLPGKMLYSVEYTADLFYECGVFVGKVDKELKTFQSETLMSRKFIWMLDNVLDLYNFTFAVKDKDHHQLVMEVLDAWKSKVQPVIPQLEKGMLHGDFNDQNIIVQDDDKKVYHVSGLIDFGDVQHSCYIFEIAIAIMYLMIEVQTMDPIDVGGHVLAGYLKYRKLPDLEWDILVECVAARFVQSLVMGAYSYEQDPGNTYLLATQSKGWKVLTQLWSMPKEQIISHWKNTIESYENRDCQA